MGKTVYLNIKKVSRIAIFMLVIITVLLMYLKIKYQVIGLFFKFKIHIIIYVILFIFAHELLHGVGFKIICNAPWENIRYGFDKKHKVPYCSCKDLIHERNKFVAVILLPTIIMGIVTLIITYYSMNLLWTYISAYVFAGGMGDIYMAYDVMKYPKNYKFIDHPSEPGYIVYEN